MNTKTIVTPITAVRGAKKEPVTRAYCALAVPFSTDGEHQLLRKAVEEANLLSDMKAIWFAYPNLKEAAEKLDRMLTHAWPSRSAHGGSAVGEAVITALRRVKEGLEAREESRDFIISNFLDGLCTVAQDVAGVQAWGYQNGKPLEQYDDSAGDFEKWANANAFTEVRFFFKTETTGHEIQGTRLKLLCAVASTKDVGVVARYK